MLSVELVNDNQETQRPTEKKGKVTCFRELENHPGTILDTYDRHFEPFSSTEIGVPSDLLDRQPLEPEPVYFLPSGLLDDGTEMEIDQATGHGGYCLIDHADAIRSVVGSALDYKLYAPCASSPSDCSSSDTSHPSLEFCSDESSVSSNVSSCTSPISLGIFVPLRELRQESSDLILFNASDGKAGVSVGDIKLFKHGSLLDPDDEVLLPWCDTGDSTWIQVIVEECGYQKWIFSIPVQCRCAVTTRGKLAWDIAQAMEFYYQTVPRRTGFQDRPSFRGALSDQRLLALHRNVAEQEIWWRVIFSDSHTVHTVSKESWE